MANPVTDCLEIIYPIIQGGMGNISDPKLAAAISEAGGLGTIGAGTLSPSEVTEKIKTLMSHTNKPCCVNIPITVNDQTRQITEVVIEQKVPIVSLSAGNPTYIISQLKEYQIKVICVCSTVEHAKKAEAVGADIIVCEGYEAAGINALNESTTMTIVPQIVKNVSVPVVAAGGIADGKGLAAALTLGASGVQMGTRFVATKEAGFHNAYKRQIMESTDESTIIVGRSFHKIRRIMRGIYADKLLDLERKSASVEDFVEMTDEIFHANGALKGDFVQGFINSGQIAGLIDDCPSVSELMDSMVKEAKALLSESLQII